MVGNTYIVMLPASLERTVTLNWLLYIFLNQANHITEIFIQSNQYKLQTLSLVFGSFLSLSLDDVK